MLPAILKDMHLRLVTGNETVTSHKSRCIAMRVGVITAIKRRSQYSLANRTRHAVCLIVTQ